MYHVIEISYFLHIFVQRLEQTTSKRIIKIETDFSLTLLQACCEGFNDAWNLYEYICNVYKYVEIEGRKLDKKTITYVAIL